MRNIIAAIIVGLMLTSAFSCIVQRPVSQEKPQNNQDYKVAYLFEHDGCKVYRFMDRGNYVYFTNCKGNVTAISSDSTKARVETIGKTIP